MMNLHFVSFLFDISVWVVLGAFAGKEVFSHHLKGGWGKIRIQLLYTIVSLITGFFAVLIGGLPEKGLAVESLAYVAFALLVFTIIRYSGFRAKIFKSIHPPVSHTPKYFPAYPK